MKRIEDIRSGKKKVREVDPVPADFSAEEFLADVAQTDAEVTRIEAEKMPIIIHKSKGKTIIKWFIFLFITIATIFFCGFELVKVRAKISQNIGGLNSSFSDLTDAMSKKDFSTVSSQIKILNQKTNDSVIILQSVGQDVYVLNLLYPKGKSSKVTGEIDIVRGSQMLTNSFDQILNFDSLSVSNSSGLDYLSKINGYLQGFGQVLAASPAKIKYAKIFSREANNLNSSLGSSALPQSEQKSVESLQKFSKTSVDFFDYLSSVPENLSNALTISGGKKSYLILFLNNAEIRPGGGFIGSFARLDLENGQAVALDFETNIYTLDKAFLAAGNVVAPPDELKTVTSTWAMRDSNVYADYSESSKKVAWFYQQESGNKVDGVIALDTTLFRNLLKATGPINMPEYNMTVTDQNFLTDVQYQVEIGYFQNRDNWAENQPKKILADMMPKFVAAMTKNGQTQSQVGKEITKAISEKHLMAYSTDSTVEDLLDGFGLSGRIHNTGGDYLYLSDANIGGLKSSLNITQTVNQNITINDNGGVNEKLSILRKHNGSYEWPDGENKNLLRIFLPLSVQIDSPGLKTEVISDKTSVSYWQNTKPGETSNSEVDYHHNNAVDLGGQSFDYVINIQKQPGIESYNWNLYIVYPVGWKPQNIEGFDATNRQIYLSSTISKDSVFRLRFIRD